MKGFLRRLRGFVGTALTWAAGFAVFGALIGVTQGAWDQILALIPSNAGVGFFFGSVFAVVLSITERHRRIEDLSIPRMGLWGALAASLVVGGIQLGFLGSLHWETLLILAVFSGGLSSGSLALAKRAETKLLEGDDEPLPALEGE